MLRVRLVHAHQQVFHGPATQVVLPAEWGEVSVLDAHAPMLCVLTQGSVQIDEARFPVRRGLAGVSHNMVTIVTS